MAAYIEGYINWIKSGFAGITTMINDIILHEETGHTDTMIVNKMGPIYQEEYDKDPIYIYLNNTM